MYNSNDSVVDDCNFRPEAGYLQTRQQLQVESVLAHKTPMKGKTQLSLYLRTAFFILALLRFACLFFSYFFFKKKKQTLVEAFHSFVWHTIQATRFGERVVDNESFTQHVIGCLACTRSK